MAARGFTALGYGSDVAALRSAYTDELEALKRSDRRPYRTQPLRPGPPRPVAPRNCGWGTAQQKGATTTAGGAA